MPSLLLGQGNAAVLRKSSDDCPRRIERLSKLTWVRHQQGGNSSLSAAMPGSQPDSTARRLS